MLNYQVDKKFDILLSYLRKKNPLKSRTTEYRWFSDPKLILSFTTVSSVQPRQKNKIKQQPKK